MTIQGAALGTARPARTSDGGRQRASQLVRFRCNDREREPASNRARWDRDPTRPALLDELEGPGGRRGVRKRF